MVGAGVERCPFPLYTSLLHCTTPPPMSLVMLAYYLANAAPALPSALQAVDIVICKVIVGAIFNHGSWSVWSPRLKTCAIVFIFYMYSQFIYSAWHFVMYPNFHHTSRFLSPFTSQIYSNSIVRFVQCNLRAFFHILFFRSFVISFFLVYRIPEK